MRLDRFVGRWAGTGKRRTRKFFEQGRVRCNGLVIEKGAKEVAHFDRIEVDDEVLQARVPRYVMLNKPAGVVSATVDE